MVSAAIFIKQYNESELKLDKKFYCSLVLWVSSTAPIIPIIIVAGRTVEGGTLEWQYMVTTLSANLNSRHKFRLGNPNQNCQKGSRRLISFAKFFTTFFAINMFNRDIRSAFRAFNYVLPLFLYDFSFFCFYFFNFS